MARLLALPAESESEDRPRGRYEEEGLAGGLHNEAILRPAAAYPRQTLTELIEMRSGQWNEMSRRADNCADEAEPAPLVEIACVCGGCAAKVCCHCALLMGAESGLDCATLK